MIGTVLLILLSCLIISFFIENLTELFVKDSITEPLRIYAFKIKRPKIIAYFLQNWLSCGRCFSGILSLSTSFYVFYILLEFNLFWVIVLWNFMWFLSNILHHLRDRVNPNYGSEDL